MGVLDEIESRSKMTRPGVVCGVTKALRLITDPQVRADIITAMMTPSGTYTNGVIGEVLAERAGLDRPVPALTVGNHARMLRGEPGGKCRCERP